MELSQLALAATDGELTELLQQFLTGLGEKNPSSPLGKLKNPKLNFIQDRAILLCDAQIGFTVPIEAKLSCKPSADGQSIEITLENLSARIAMGGSMITNGVMRLLTHALEGKKGVSISGKTISVRPSALLPAGKLQMAGNLREITLAPGKISLLLA